MPTPIDPLRIPHRDITDADWKRDVDRFTRDAVGVIAELVARIEQLERRVN